jgi:hypothetical protein
MQRLKGVINESFDLDPSKYDEIQWIAGVIDPAWGILHLRIVDWK